MDFLTGFITAFSLIFAIIDPFASIPMFLTLTKGHTFEEQVSSADNAIVVAGVIAIAFLFFGTALLGIFGVSINSFKIFGGIVLALLAVETVLGISFGSANKPKDIQVATVIIASPMLTGPGVITSMVVLTSIYGMGITFAATICALALSWIILRNSPRIVKLVGNNNLEIAAKVMGLLLGAMGVQFILAGLGVA
jgi:multiple antibiotic resistance protein